MNIFKKKIVGAPPVVEKPVLWLLQHGLEVEGIFRISGSHSQVLELKKNLEKGLEFELDNFDVHVVAGAIMQWLVELRPPLMTFDYHDNFIEAQKIEQEEERQKRITEVLGLLPPWNRASLFLLFKLFYEIHRNSGTNKMTSTSLAIILSPSLMQPRPNPNQKNYNIMESLNREAENLKISIMLLENLILNHDILFQRVEEKTQSEKARSPRPKKEKEKKEKKKPADDLERVIMPEDAEFISSLQAIFANPSASEVFMKYLQEKERSEENLNFYREVEKYKQLQSNSERITHLRYLMKEFISETAPLQVNLDDDVRNSLYTLLENYETCGEMFVDDELATALDTAQAYIFRLINEHSYPRFLQSAHCRALIKEYEKNQKKK